MARASYIWVVEEYGDGTCSAWTVKHEMLAALRREEDVALRDICIMRYRASDKFIQEVDDVTEEVLAILEKSTT